MYVDETKTVQFEHTDKVQVSPTIWDRQDAAARKARRQQAKIDRLGSAYGMGTEAMQDAYRQQQQAATSRPLSPEQAFQEQP